VSDQQPIMIVGEAWGKDEAEARLPFVGKTGGILRVMLRQVGIDISSVYLTNVFNLQPPGGNDVKNLCGSRPEAIKGMPALNRGKFVRAEYLPEIERLYHEIATIKPNIVITCGATPTWALLHTNGIAKHRGAPFSCPIPGPIAGVKVLPTYHPSAVARDWKLRPIVIADLHKAKREAEFPEIRRPRREIWIEPTFKDINTFYNEYMLDCDELSIDIETIGNQITCIGFAPTEVVALVIPFYDPRQKDGNYWRTIEEELRVWDLVRYFCSLDRAVVGQNFMYDMRFLLDSYGIPCPNTNDTMLLHHALQPEMQKSLNFLASVYSDELKWKFMGGRGTLTRKKED